VTTRCTMRGTHQSEFRGIAPAGKQITVTELGIFRFSEGKVVESWYSFDQLGVIPKPESS
jgi:predicted ester cyclase